MQAGSKAAARGEHVCRSGSPREVHKCAESLQGPAGPRCVCNPEGGLPRSLQKSKRFRNT